MLVLHDESEAVAGDGHDAEGRHEDGEVLASLHELAEVLGVLRTPESEILHARALYRVWRPLIHNVLLSIVDMFHQLFG